MARWLVAGLITLIIHTGVGVAVVSTYNPVKPILECVEPMPDGSFVAHFGYWNRSEETLQWDVGATNKFLGAQENRGQTTIFASGRSRPFPKAAFKVVSAGEELRWELDGQLATASVSSRSCSTKVEAPELPEPQLQKIEPVVEEAKPEPPQEQPKPQEEATPREEAQKETKNEPPPRPRPKSRKPRKQRKRAKKVEPAPLIVSSAGDFGDVGVRTGEEDSFGSAAVKTDAPKNEEPVASGGDAESEGTSAPAPRKRLLPRILKKVAGKYPPQESGLGRYVKVKLSLRVGPKGRVQKVRILRGGGSVFDKEALRVAKLLKFRPGTIDGIPEAMWIPWEIEFWPPR